MGIMTGVQIQARVSAILQDLATTRWTVPEILNYINDAQREIAILRPDATATTEVLALNAADVRQTLPVIATRLLDVTRNINADGSPGRAVRQVSRKLMDAQNPFWSSDPWGGYVVNYMFDERNPYMFFVYPRPAAGAKVEVVYSAAPTDLTDIGDNIELDDVWFNPMVSFVLSLCYAKDDDYARNLDAAKTWMDLFTSQVQGRTASDAQSLADRQLGPEQLR